MSRLLKPFKKRFFTKENIWALLLSYVLSIFTARFGMFLICVVYQFYCGLVIRQVHYHHYVWGFLFLVLGLVLFWRFFDLISVILVGVGSGFIFDEFIMILFGEDSIGYWSRWNIIPIATGLVLLNVVFLLVPQEKGLGPAEFDLKHLTKRLKMIARFGEKIFFSKFGPIKEDQYSITKTGYLATMIVFILIILLILYGSEARL